LGIWTEEKQKRKLDTASDCLFDNQVGDVNLELCF
jgi:hypothetical protein